MGLDAFGVLCHLNNLNKMFISLEVVKKKNLFVMCDAFILNFVTLVIEASEMYAWLESLNFLYILKHGNVFIHVVKYFSQHPGQACWGPSSLTTV